MNIRGGRIKRLEVPISNYANITNPNTDTLLLNIPDVKQPRNPLLLCTNK